MTTLTIVFPGTSMRWQHQANFLEMHVDKPHNMHDTQAEHRYFFADGVAVEPTDDHYVVTSVNFDPNNKNRLLSGRTQNVPGQHLHEMLWGSGMRRNAKAVFNMIKYYTSPPHNMALENITIVGFSRGGCVAKVLSQLLAKDAALSKIDINMALIDPVPGPGNNTQSLRRVPPNVKKYLVGLSLDETAIGFDPLDKEQTIFESPKTRYCFLPFKGDHLGNNFWMRGLIRKFLPINSPLYSQERTQRDKLLQAVACLPSDPERDARVALYNKNLKKYARSLSVETYYRYKDSEFSLQADASKAFKKIGSITKKINCRRVKFRHDKYVANVFVNAHHEWLFGQDFPYLYAVMKGAKLTGKMLKKSQAEIARMPPYTKKFFTKKFRLSCHKMQKYLVNHSSSFSSNCEFKKLGDFFVYGKPLPPVKHNRVFRKNYRRLGVLAVGRIMTKSVEVLATVLKPAAKKLKIIPSLVFVAQKKARFSPIKSNNPFSVNLAEELRAITEPALIFRNFKNMLLVNNDAVSKKLPGAKNRTLKEHLANIYLERVIEMLNNPETAISTRKQLLQFFITISSHPLILSTLKEQIIGALVADTTVISQLSGYPAFNIAICEALKAKEIDGEENLIDWLQRYGNGCDFIKAALEALKVADKEGQVAAEGKAAPWNKTVHLELDNVRFKTSRNSELLANQDPKEAPVSVDVP